MARSRIAGTPPMRCTKRGRPGTHLHAVALSPVSLILHLHASPTTARFFQIPAPPLIINPSSNSYLARFFQVICV